MKEIILDGPLEKAKYYVIRMEFQESSSSHIQLFIWIFNARNIANEATHIEFIEKTKNVQLPDRLNVRERFEFVKTYNSSLLYFLSGNTIRMNVASHMVDILLRGQLLQNQLFVNLAMLKSKMF